MSKDKGPDTKIIKELITEAGRNAAASVDGVSKVLDFRTDIDHERSTAEADVYLKVIYGYKIPAVSWDVQQAVRSSVRSAVHYDCEKIDIHIQGVGRGKTEE